MVHCSECKIDQSKDSFSASQLNKQQSVRRCKQCIQPVVHDRIAVLYQWLRHHGALVQNVQVREMGPEYRTVYVNNRVNKNEVLLSIPRACIMTTSDAKSSAIGKALEQTKINVHNHTWLALYVLQERQNPSSFFTPYLQLLPIQYSSMPLFFGSDEMKELSGCFVAGMVNAIKFCIREEYDKLRQYLPSFQSSIDEFLWARLVVISRIFSMPAIKEEGLVPLADMLNHKSAATTTWNYCDKKTAFLITSTCTQLTGVEVFDSYGPKCNSRYFVNYGFTLPNNESQNQAAVFIKPESLTALQVSLVGDPCTYDDGYSYYQVAVDRMLEEKVRCNGYYRFQLQCPGLNVPDSDPRESLRLDGLRCTLACLRFLRVVVATPEELKLIAQRFEQYMKAYPTTSRSVHLLASFDIQPVSVQNEIEVLNRLRLAVDQRIDEFPTSYESDQQALALATPFSNWFNILTIRCSEKKVLSDTHALCTMVIDTWSQYKHVFKVAKRLRSVQLTSNYIKTHWDKLKAQQ